VANERHITTEGGDYAESGDIHSEQGIIISEQGFFAAEVVVGVLHQHITLPNQSQRLTTIPAGKFARIGIPAVSVYYPLNLAEYDQVYRLITGDEPLHLVHMHGMPGIGKSTLIANLARSIQSSQFPGGVLWGDFDKVSPSDFMLRSLLLLDGPNIGVSALPQIPLRELFWQCLTHLPNRWLLVLDHLHSMQQLHEILPPEAASIGDCRIIVINNNRIPDLPADWRWQSRTLQRLPIPEAMSIYTVALGHERVEHFASKLESIIEALDHNLQLILTSMRLFQSGASNPSLYLERLKAQDGQRTLSASRLAEHLNLVIESFTPPQQHLFDCIGVLGAGEWNCQLLAAIAMRRPADILPDLRIFVETNIIDYRPTQSLSAVVGSAPETEIAFTVVDRFRAGTLTRALALRRLEARGDYYLRAAQTLMAHYCLGLVEDLVQELQIRAARLGEPNQPLIDEQDRYVRSFRVGLAADISHVRQALHWAQKHEEWGLVSRFAALPYMALLQHFTANSFEITLNIDMGLLVEPLVWQPSDPPYIRLSAFVHSEGMSIHPETRPSTSDDSVASFGTTLLAMDSPITIPECDLNWNLIACHLLDGVFQNTCFTDSSWIGVNARNVLLIAVDMAGCRFLSCNFDNSTWIHVRARNAQLKGTSLRYASLRNIWLNGANLQQVDFSYASLVNVRFNGANLRGANFQGARLKGTSFRQADVYNATFQSAMFEDVDYKNSNIEYHQLAGIRFRDKVSFTNVGNHDELQRMDEQVFENLNNSPNINGYDLRGIYLQKLNRLGLNAVQVDLCGATLSGVNIRLPQSLMMNASLRGANFSHAYLAESNLCDADLRASNFSGANLVGAHLNRALGRAALFKGTILTGANLEAADFSRADYSNCQLQKAVLRGACFNQANLQGAALMGAYLDDASFVGADLRNADLQDAVLINTHFQGADLRDAKVLLEQLYFVASIGKARLPSGDEVFYSEGEHVQLPPLPAFVQFSQWNGVYTYFSFPTECGLRAARLDGIFTSITFDNTSLEYAQLRGIFSYCSFAQARLDKTVISGTFYKTNFQRGMMHDAILHKASFVCCDFTGADFNNDLFKQAARLRGSLLPDGSEYDGRYELPGDLEDARTAGISLEDKEAMREFSRSKDQIPYVIVR
jgi:uncharacterized protein YjbI with pentapeptide repeats